MVVCFIRQSNAMNNLSGDTQSFDIDVECAYSRKNVGMLGCLTCPFDSQLLHCFHFTQQMELLYMVIDDLCTGLWEVHTELDLSQLPHGGVLQTDLRRISTA